MKIQKRHGFTLIELMVVVAIIGALAGLILPAISSAQDSARINTSKMNAKQIHMGLVTYESKYNKLWTGVPETLSEWDMNTLNPNAGPLPAFRFGNGGATAAQALQQWHNAVAYDGWLEQSMGVNWGRGGEEASFAWGGTGSTGMIVPYTWHEGAPGNPGGIDVKTPGGNFQASDAGMGTWRFPNTMQISADLGGPNAEMFFAPKDGSSIDILKKLNCYDNTSDMCDRIGEDIRWRCSGVEWNVGEGGGRLYGLPSTYTMSPAAMMNSKCWSDSGFQDPMSIARGFRQPNTGMAKYGSLKTILCEHPMLQNNQWDCASVPVFQDTFMDPEDPDSFNYNGCPPYLFNSYFESEPVICHMDGSTRTLMIKKAQQDARLTEIQGEQGFSSDGLFHRQTPDGEYCYMLNHGFWNDDVSGSCGMHTHTVNGIRGRDHLNQ